MSIAAPPSSSPRVVVALESTRRSLGRFRLGLVAAGLALGGIAWLVVIAGADLAWVLPTWSRALALIGLVVAALVAVAKAMRRSREARSPIQTAGEIESAYPELGQRVRTTLEYLEPTTATMPASPALVGALVADTDRRSEPLEFSVIVPWSRLKRRLLGVACLMASIAVGVAWDRTLAIAAGRVLLVPVHYTKLAVEPGNATIKAGSEFLLKATFSGRPVSSARWVRREIGNQGAWQSIPLGDDSRPLIGPIESRLKDCQADFEYRVIAGELSSDVYQVLVTHPLIVKSFEARVEPPAYLKQKPSVVTQGDFSALAGSKVKFTLLFDRLPVSARITSTVEGSPTPQTLTLGRDGNKRIGEFAVGDRDVRYEISATAADSMRLEPLKYRIKVIPDAKPTVRFLKPEETHSATATTEVPIQLQASDDHGVSRVGISYRVDDDPEETLYLDNPAGQPVQLDVLAKLYLEKHPLTISNSLTYRAFVEDNRMSNPQRVESELRFIDILPYKQDYQLVEGGTPSDGRSVTLEELILRQRVALNRTQAHAEDQPVEDKVAERLSQDEAELTLATEEFGAKLQSEFGAIHPLDSAVRAMQAATASLGSKDFRAALPLEQAAMASLVKARENLRKLMTNSSTAARSQKIDRQQRDQKIRKPPADQARQAELAKLEQDIRMLADAEKKFAEDLTPKSGGEAHLDRQNEPKPGQASQSAGPKPSPSPSQYQQAAAKEAGRLEALAQQDKALTELARRRMADAAKQVEQSAAAIELDKKVESAEAARSAAEGLDKLADQVAALKAEDLSDRIARARDLARATAKAERDLAGQEPDHKSEAARQQQSLAEDTKTLADLLKEAQADAVEEDRTLATALARAAEANSLAEVEAAMRRASADLASNPSGKEGPALKEAEAKLDGLARDLESARRDFMQPKLQQLLAAEKQAAEAQKALDSAATAAGKAEAEKAVADLARTMQSLKSADPSIRQAADALAEMSQPSTNNAWTPPQKNGVRPGLFTPPVSYTKGVGEVAKALQARIQALIVDDAMVDRDGPVPPGYKQKVEDYFRVLSEDLR